MNGMAGYETYQDTKDGVSGRNAFTHPYGRLGHCMSKANGVKLIEFFVRATD